jgi:hypothetical protein
METLRVPPSVEQGKLVGAKPPLRPSQGWPTSTKPDALFRKLRGCDVIDTDGDDERVWKLPDDLAGYGRSEMLKLHGCFRRISS